MAAEESPLSTGLSAGDRVAGLAREWRSLSRIATIAAAMTAPAVFVWLHVEVGWGVAWSILATILIVGAFTIAPSEVETIDRLTSDKVFRFRFQQLQDGTAALVLDDLRLPPPEEQTAPAETQPAPADTTTAQ